MAEAFQCRQTAHLREWRCAHKLCKQTKRRFLQKSTAALYKDSIFISLFRATDMTTASLHNIIFKNSAEAPQSEEYKLEQTQIIRAIRANIRRELTERGLQYQFHFATRRISDTTRAEQAYITPAALAAIKNIPGIKTIFPMKISTHPLTIEV